jgi:DNA-binding CsgD family transcriptional regulator
VALLGRDAETTMLAAMLQGAVAEAPVGGSLVICGQPGIGKSALLRAAAGRARDDGMLVLTCSGVASEAHLAYAGLQQLLWPVHDSIGLLAARERDALSAALGMVDGPAPSHLVGLATLELLAESAHHSAVLVVADDVHWLDEPTSAVLAFLGSRLGADPVVLLAACRDGEPGGGHLLGAAGLPGLRLGPLDQVAAAALLDSQARLDPPARRRVLDVAAGNPLALVELPVALRHRHHEADLIVELPLTARLERAFAARLTGLPPASRIALLAAALDDGDAVTEVLAAAGRVAGTELTPADLAPAVAGGLVEIDAVRIRFRHPLVRSAIRQATGLAQRQEMHGALAEVLATVPERRVWHRAASTVGPDDEVAAELEHAATRADRAGAISVAIAALIRAAQLTSEPGRRGRRLIRAAWQVYGFGQLPAARRLVAEAETLELAPGDLIRLRHLRTSLGTGRSGGESLAGFAELADRMRRVGDSDEAMDVLVNVSLNAWWSNPGWQVGRRLAAVAEATPAPADDPNRLFVLATADPVGRGAAVLRGLRRWQPADGNPTRDYLLGYAANAIGACDQAVAFHEAASAGLRAQNQLGLLGQNLVAQAWMAALLGRLDAAVTAADEGARILETAMPFWVTCTQLVTAVVAGRRGDAATAADLTDQAERVLLTAGIPPMLALVQFARGVAALGTGHFDEAYDELARIFDPGDVTYHPHLRSWALLDLVEAAGRSGNRPAARARHAELVPIAATSESPLLRVGLTVAAPMLADDEEAGPLFDEALRADLAAWPLQRARLLLAYGFWLRRRRQVVESRPPLRAARDTFDALGAVVGGERARQELCAAGEDSEQSVPGSRDRLTPQEWHIARLAAHGFTSPEIAKQLYLSQRTISNHLYRIFPKLGITSRAELAAAMANQPRDG